MEKASRHEDSQMKKGKALVLITGPYQLLQAIWYAAEHPHYDYHALIKTAHLNKTVSESVIEGCRNCELFRSVRITKGVNLDSGIVEWLLLFLKMILYYFVGQRKRLTQQLIWKEIGSEKYDLVIVDSENSLLGGAFIDHAKADYKVVILQEGFSDILPRLDRPKPTFREIINYVLARMGYCNPGLFYKLDSVQYCVKLSSFPERLVYRPFASVETILNGPGNPVYRQAIEKAFPNMGWEMLRSAEIIIITSLLDILKGGTHEYAAMQEWLKSHVKGKMLIKRHPRDEYPYHWEGMDVQYMDTTVPAELVLAHSTGKKVYFSFISTCLPVVMESDIDYRVFRFDSIKTEYYNRLFSQLQQQISLPEERIIHLQ